MARLRDVVERSALPSTSSRKADAEYLDQTVQLLRDIANERQASVLVDNSKTQNFSRRRGQLLRGDPRINMTVLHVDRPLASTLSSAYKSKGALAAPDRNRLRRTVLTPLTRMLSQYEAARLCIASDGLRVDFDLLRVKNPEVIASIAHLLDVPVERLLNVLDKELPTLCAIGGNRLRQGGGTVRMVSA